MRRLLFTMAVGALAWTPSVQGLDSAALAATPRPCRAADLSAGRIADGAGMSHPFVVIGLVNRGRSSCTLHGYPNIAAMRVMSGERIPLLITNGDLMNVAGPRPRSFALVPGAHAWFAVGAATAYDPPLVTITRIAVRFGATPSLLSIPIVLPASAPQGESFPVGVTAYAAGDPPPVG